LSRIFGLADADLADGFGVELCRRFLAPLWAEGTLCDDALPTIAELRRRGLRTAILSNTPWGSPGDLWRQELGRMGLARAVDVLAFCTDAGYRKPDRRAFEYVLARLALPPGACLFVGDDPRWDLAGPRAIGMRAVLIDRRRTGRHGEEHPIADLHQLLTRL
jgi:putative hydrolase of the HAD superfamily